MKHKTQKQLKHNIVRTRHYNCAYVKAMAVLIIFPVKLQTIINVMKTMRMIADKNDTQVHKHTLL